MKKEDVKVDVTDGHLAISGERKTEAEEKKEQFYITQPFHIRHAVPAGHDDADGEAVIAAERLAVERPGKQRLGFHRVLERDASRELLPHLECLLAEDDVLVAFVGAEEHHLARLVVDADPLQHVAQPHARESAVRGQALHRAGAVPRAFVAVDHLGRSH
jgi:hypothetical protein